MKLSVARRTITRMESTGEIWGQSDRIYEPGDLKIVELHLGKIVT